MPFTPKLTYKGKPLVRKDNELYYGCMTDRMCFICRSSPPRPWAVWMWQTRSICSCSLPMSPSPVRPAWHVRPPRTACTMRWTSAASGCRRQTRTAEPKREPQAAERDCSCMERPLFCCANILRYAELCGILILIFYAQKAGMKLCCMIRNCIIWITPPPPSLLPRWRT